jgi:NAD(P)-dependent dehydrogenase (short-subunit alcohol dehydrogenase family)/acyl carrier protein
LLIVGRTPIEGGPADAAADRISALQALKATAAASGGHVLYETADVTDRQRLHEVVGRAVTRFGCDLDGVLHLAGVFKDRLVIEETTESLADTLAPKLAGAQALDDILVAYNGTLFVSFGSVTSYLGRLGGGAYAAANALLEGITRSQRRRGVRAYCLSWSAWDNLGMIRGYSTASGSSRGYYALTRTQGLNSFLAAMHSTEPVVLIGVDARASGVRRLVAGECRAIEQLVVSVPADSRVPSELVVENGFGGTVVCGVVSASSSRDSAVPGSRRETPRPPQTELERTIARAWQEVLNISEPDVNSTFFDLGGSSLLISRVYVRLRERIAAELSMTEMFRYPTIAALAGYLAGRANSESAEIGRDRSRGQDRRARVLRGRRPATIS